jgi:hypothetical protein
VKTIRSYDFIDCLKIAVGISLLVFVFNQSKADASSGLLPSQSKPNTQCEPVPEPYPGDIGALLPAEYTVFVYMNLNGLLVKISITLYGQQKVMAIVESDGNATTNIHKFNVNLKLQRKRPGGGLWKPYNSCWYNKQPMVAINGPSLAYLDTDYWWLKSTKYRYRLVASAWLETDSGVFSKTKTKIIPHS